MIPALAIFVYVRLNTTPRRLWRHLREQVVEDLRRAIGEHPCLERLLERRVKTFTDASSGDGLPGESLQRSKGDEEGITEFLDQTVKDRNLATILTHLVRCLHRLEARAWLRGDSLPESVLERLGVITSDPDEDEDAEGRARRVVLALCRLAKPSPFIVCFDQVEALEVEGDKKAGFEAFGRMGAGLHDHADHLALISCIQTAQLNDLTQYVRGSDRDRVFKARSELKPLNLDQAQALVRQRLDAVAELAQLRKKHKSPLWPLDEKDLQTVIEQHGCPARRLITTAVISTQRARGTEVPPETTGEFA